MSLKNTFLAKFSLHCIFYKNYKILNGLPDCLTMILKLLRDTILFLYALGAEISAT